MEHRDEELHPDLADLWSAVRKIPFFPGDFIDKVFTGTTNEIGKRTLFVLLTAWDATGGGPFAASAIGTLGADKAVQMLEDIFVVKVFSKVLKALGADRLRMRASLCASQVVGLGMMRYVSRTEPLASADVSTVVAAVAPTLQRYLTGEID